VLSSYKKKENVKVEKEFEAGSESKKGDSSSEEWDTEASTEVENEEVF
jgi:hypothetical protein